MLVPVVAADQAGRSFRALRARAVVAVAAAPMSKPRSLLLRFRQQYRSLCLLADSAVQQLPGPQAIQEQLALVIQRSERCSAHLLVVVGRVVLLLPILVVVVVVLLTQPALSEAVVRVAQQVLARGQVEAAQ